MVDVYVIIYIVKFLFSIIAIVLIAFEYQKFASDEFKDFLQHAMITFSFGLFALIAISLNHLTGIGMLKMLAYMLFLLAILSVVRSAIETHRFSKEFGFKEDAGELYADYVDAFQEEVI